MCIIVLNQNQCVTLHVRSKFMYNFKIYQSNILFIFNIKVNYKIDKYIKN